MTRRFVGAIPRAKPLLIPAILIYCIIKARGDAPGVKCVDFQQVVLIFSR